MNSAISSLLARLNDLRCNFNVMSVLEAKDIIIMAIDRINEMVAAIQDRDCDIHLLQDTLKDKEAAIKARIEELNEVKKELYEEEIYIDSLESELYDDEGNNLVDRHKAESENLSKLVTSLLNQNHKLCDELKAYDNVAIPNNSFNTPDEPATSEMDATNDYLAELELKIEDRDRTIQRQTSEIKGLRDSLSATRMDLAETRTAHIAYAIESARRNVALRNNYDSLLNANNMLINERIDYINKIDKHNLALGKEMRDNAHLIKENIKLRNQRNTAMVEYDVLVKCVCSLDKKGDK